MTGRIEWTVSLDDLTDVVAKAAERGLALAGEHVLGEARDNAPVDEGELRRSGAVKAKGLEAAVGFDTPYAVEQHENLGYAHKAGGPKYLERAMTSEKDAVLRIVADTIESEVAK